MAIVCGPEQATEMWWLRQIYNIKATVASVTELFQMISKLIEGTRNFNYGSFFVRNVWIPKQKLFLSKATRNSIPRENSLCELASMFISIFLKFSRNAQLRLQPYRRIYVKLLNHLNLPRQHLKSERFKTILNSGINFLSILAVDGTTSVEILGDETRS